jgi:hypothetical protein
VSATVEAGWRTGANFAHLCRLSTAKGVFEHCEGAIPRPECGYCTDDVARALLAVAREPATAGPESRTLTSLAHAYLGFLVDAYRGDGRFANRRHLGGRWLDGETFDIAGDDQLADASGRAVWALGEASVGLADAGQRRLASQLFDEACRFRSPWPRSTAFAVLGAGAVASADPSHVGAAMLLADAAQLVTGWSMGLESSGWPWPEPRLTYANAVLPEMLLVLGRELRLDTFVDEGLRQLGWLADVDTAPGGWLSVTPVGGWGSGEPRPGFDQQPIEVAALADASATAWTLTRDPQWIDVLVRCGDWFLGHNDSATVMVDVRSGAGFDGLTPEGRNENCGAESTIAAITTLQWARLVA